MAKYMLRRLVELVITVFLIATATFFLLEAVPGDALSERADKLPVESRTALYERYGLDKSMMERYVLTMKRMCRGDFGESFVYAGQTVTGLIRDRLPVSARLGLQQMLLGVSVGLLLGILAATRRGTIVDYLVVGLSVLLISIPHLVFGLMLQKIFAGSLRWFPTIGWPSGSELWLGGWKYTVLPTLTGAFSYIASYARLMKTSLLDVINQDYVLTAESKGLSRAAVVRKHMLRNSFKYVNYSDLKKFASDFKAVYNAPNEKAGLEALSDVREKWGKKYPYAVSNWENNWEDVSPFFQFPDEVRRIMYTTNIIEGLNRQYRKVTKTKSVFPSDSSLEKMLYLASLNVAKKWTQRYRNWDQVLNQLTVLYGERLTQYL